MSQLFTLPRETTATELFESILPAELADLEIRPGLSAERVAIHVEGEDGGHWTLGVEGTGISIRTEDDTHAMIQLTVSADDARELLLGSVRDRMLEALGGIEQVADQISPALISSLLMTDEQLKRLNPHRGDLQIIVDDPDEAASHRVTLTLGGGVPDLDSPRAVVTIGVADWIELLTRRVEPQQAFMQGRIRMAGDMGLPMGLFAALTAP